MKLWKNFLAGLVVSFIGSVPLGYLNIIGSNIYMKDGGTQLTFYILGIISIEAVVIAFTLYLANWLIQQKKLIFWIEMATVVFLVFLAGNFYFASVSSENVNLVSPEGKTFSGMFLFGLILSVLNVVQWPFWAGWNIYLVDNGYIQKGKLPATLYLTGALAGTVTGMFVFAYVVSQASNISIPFLNTEIQLLIPILFLLLAGLQIFKMVKKYRKK
ncbi:MAG TPA: hypothetical protein PKD91_05770 [Bacteroidia bacterium]|nr:hypothetical protein [Bacteroidia bacterium]